MFDHPLIQIYPFEEVPLGQDIYLMDEKWMSEFEAALVKSLNGSGGSAYSVGYYSPAAAIAFGEDWIELSWYPNHYDRFHEVRVTLPRSEFVTCVASWQYDYNPVIFVRNKWLTNLHLGAHSIFALVDAIGVKRAIAAGILTRATLVALRAEIDEIAARNESVAFLSFADSLLLKAHYWVGQYDSKVKYTYDPERILRLLPDIRAAYKSVLGLEIYAVVTQGSNEFYDDDLISVSRSGHHVSMNSLGLPFAQIQSIDQSARAAIKNGAHLPADVYLDETFYRSLRFKRTFEKAEQPQYPYTTPMSEAPANYFPMSLRTVIDELKAPAQ